MREISDQIGIVCVGTVERLSLRLMQITNLPAHMISRRDHAAIDKGRVQGLADSIRDVGLISPLFVTPAKIIRNGSEVDGWDILAGRHRYSALNTILMWDEIPCIVCETNEVIAEMITIDENLARRDLSPAERALQPSRRKDLYEILHPETRNGGDRKSDRQSADLKSDRFTKATAEATGKSEASIQRDARRGKELRTVIPSLKGTSLDKPGEMDALIKLPQKEREEIVRKAAAGKKVTAKPAKPASDQRNLVGAKLQTDGAEAQAKPAIMRLKPADTADELCRSKADWMNAIASLWNSGAQGWREEFVSLIQAPAANLGKYLAPPSRRSHPPLPLPNIRPMPIEAKAHVRGLKSLTAAQR